MIVKIKKFLFIKMYVKKEVHLYIGLFNAPPHITWRSSPRQVIFTSRRLRKIKMYEEMLILPYYIEVVLSRQ